MSDDPLETLWDSLLSREPDLIREAYQALSPEDQKNVLEHLQAMSSEPGWHPEQRLSALAALQALAQ